MSAQQHYECEHCGPVEASPGLSCCPFCLRRSSSAPLRPLRVVGRRRPLGVVLQLREVAQLAAVTDMADVVERAVLARAIRRALAHVEEAG